MFFEAGSHSFFSRGGEAWSLIYFSGGGGDQIVWIVV